MSAIASRTAPGFSISRGGKGGRSENLTNRLRLISILCFDDTMSLGTAACSQPTVRSSYDKCVTVESRWYHEGRENSTTLRETFLSATIRTTNPTHTVAPSPPR